MLIKLALQNIKGKKIRTYIAIFSVCICTTVIVLFLSLSNGIQKASFNELEKKSPLNQITVVPKTQDASIFSLLGGNTESFNETALNTIREIKGIRNIYKETQYKNFSSLEVQMLGFSLITDTLVFGLPYEYIKNDIKTKDRNVWNSKSKPYPTLIPRQLLNLYNTTIASSKNLPRLSEENLTGKILTLYPDYSTFFPIYNDKKNTIELEVVGFSDKINLIGVTLPYEIIEELNEKQNIITKIVVETEDASMTKEVAGKIEKLGYETNYFQKNLEDVEAKLNYLNYSLAIISLIIIVSCTLTIISTFISTITERSKEIGLYKALGANNIHLRNIILMEALIIGIIGSIIGVIISYLLIELVESSSLFEINKDIFYNKTIFLTEKVTILKSFIFSNSICIIASLIPILKAQKITPINSLKQT